MLLLNDKEASLTSSGGKQNYEHYMCRNKFLCEEIKNPNFYASTHYWSGRHRDMKKTNKLVYVFLYSSIVNLIVKLCSKFNSTSNMKLKTCTSNVNDLICTKKKKQTINQDINCRTLNSYIIGKLQKEQIVNLDIVSIGYQMLFIVQKKYKLAK